MTPSFQAICEWDIKNREWALTHCSTDGKSISLTFRILCARFPNNSYQLIKFDGASTVKRRVVHRDALNREWMEEGGEA